MEPATSWSTSVIVHLSLIFIVLRYWAATTRTSIHVLAAGRTHILFRHFRPVGAILDHLLDDLWRFVILGVPASSDRCDIVPRLIEEPSVVFHSWPSLSASS